MGQELSFSEENIKKNPFDFPKLKLAKGETARIRIVQNPIMEWVHNIQKPQLDDRGNILMKTAEKKDGTEYSTPKLTFVSNPICLGDPEVLKEKGTDPDNCPICARAAAGQRGYQPKRRFAMHVIKVNTEPRSVEPLTPLGGQLVIWAFTDLVFNKLFEFQKTWGSLKEHDLTLGPCTDETFQKAELNVLPNTAVSDELAAQYFTEKNKAEDPTVFCGNRKAKKYIEEDLAQVDDVYARSNGEDKGSDVDSKTALASGIGALLDEDGGVPSTKSVDDATEPEPAGSFDDLPKSTPEEAPKQEAAAAPAEAKSTGSIDDILAGL